MLDGDVTDIVEAQSLSFRPQYIDIYLATWGPEDDGSTLEGPGPLTQLVLRNGIETVRECDRERKRPVGCLCVCLCAYLLKGLIFFPLYQRVYIINTLITSVCFSY